MQDQAPDGATPDAAPVEAAVAPPAPVPASRELATRPTREVLMPLDTSQVVAGMQAYQEMLPQLLDAKDYQDAGGGKKFVKKSGWRKIARAFNLSTQIVSVDIERAPDGSPQRASAVVRAIAPNGQVSDGDGYCDVAESRFSGPRGNKSKLENDLRATATTRAKNRAISDLVGMGEVSAEEAAGGASDDTPAFGPGASEDKMGRMVAALAYLFDTGEGPRDDLAARAYNAIGMRFNYVPEAVADAIRLAAGTLKQELDGAASKVTTQQQAPEPEPETVSGEVVDEGPALSPEDAAHDAALNEQLANEF